jgi:hypothetical protein
MGGTGTQTAALGFGGATTIPRGPGEVANSEEYNGTSWTEGNNLNDALVGIGGLGTQTAAVGFGGGTPNVSATEHYDGTSWTNVPGTLTSARRYLQGCGTQTAGLTAGGDGTSSNHYDGSAWTAGGNLNTGRPNTGAVSGIQTSALMSGGGSGGTPVGGKTEEYNGTSWSEIADMAVGRYASAGANGGTTSASVAFGGYLGGTGYISSTEEFNRTVNIITAAAWASGGNLNTDRTSAHAGCGTQTAGLCFGGENPDTTADTEEYNGSTWSEQNNLPGVKQKHGSAGIQTAALAIGGAPDQDQTSHYDGTSWTAGGNLGTSRYDISGTGTQTAAIAFGGQDDPDGTEEYDGSSWTSGGNMNLGRRKCGSAGTQTAALGFGGYKPASPAGHTNNTEAYNGTSWGGAPDTPATTELWDGTSWITSANMGTGRGGTAGGGTTAAFLAFGGDGDVDGTEEFTAATTALNLKTLTDS